MGTPMRKKITLSQELLKRALGAIFMQQQYLDLHTKGNIVHSDKSLCPKLFPLEQKIKAYIWCWAEMLNDVSEIIWRREMRVIYIDVCNLTIPRRSAACSWVVCLKNKPHYTQADTQEGFFTLPAFVGNSKQYKNTTFSYPRKCLWMSRV